MLPFYLLYGITLTVERHDFASINGMESCRLLFLLDVVLVVEYESGLLAGEAEV